MAEFNVAKYYNLTQKSYFDKLGKVSKIVGLTIESIGPDAKLNDLCVIHSADNESHLYAEVVGFKDSRVLLMPFDNVDGIGPGCIVENTEKPLAVKVGDAILGHTLDGLGNPMVKNWGSQKNIPLRHSRRTRCQGKLSVRCFRLV